MAITPEVVGTWLDPVSLDVERGRLRLFAEVIGETDPVYTDVEAARAAGHRDLLVPPTFLCAIQHEQADPFGWLTSMGVDMRHVLHGEQGFSFRSAAYAGERLTARARIADVYTKRGGSLVFVVRATTVTSGDGRTVAELTDTVVITGPEPAS